jgi:hypothetical protein
VDGSDIILLLTQAFKLGAAKGWSVLVYDTALIEAVCESALLQYTIEPNLLVFSNSITKARAKF